MAACLRSPLRTAPRTSKHTQLNKTTNDRWSLRRWTPQTRRMPEPFYLKVDLFDNGEGRAGKKKGNRYKVKVHLRFEDKGQEFSYLGHSIRLLADFE